MSDFGNTRNHRGRKVYRCEWCGEDIPVGETFVNFTGRWQDEFYNWRMHLECYEAASRGTDLQDGFESYEHKRASQEPK